MTVFKNHIKVLLFLLLAVLGNGTARGFTDEENARIEEHLPFGIPTSDCTDCQLIIREGYILEYDPALQDPIWAAYRLDAEDIAVKVKRSNDFREDDEIVGEKAELDDYDGYGYDRGHLVPAEDSGKNKVVMSESFYLSNMTPQTVRLNRGQWSRLERRTRELLVGRDELWIISGPEFDSGKEPKRIGDGVAVPTAFWKIIADVDDEGNLVAIGYTLPNVKTGVPKFDTTLCSVNEVEKLTGLNFFPHMKEGTKAAVFEAKPSDELLDTDLED